MIRALASALLLAGCAKGEDPAIAAAKARLPRASYQVPTTDLRVSYLHAGAPDGRTVIFVHGTPGSAQAWTDYLITVPDGLRYVAVDRPGLGKVGQAMRCRRSNVRQRLWRRCSAAIRLRFWSGTAWVLRLWPCSPPITHIRSAA